MTSVQVAFSASVSAIHAATVAGLAPASRAARYWASFRSHSATLPAVSSLSVFAGAVSRCGASARARNLSHAKRSMIQRGSFQDFCGLT
jgi:hypothetical protein